MTTYRTFALWAIRIGLFIVPFIPLYISNSLFFPFITGKAFLFRTIVEIGVVLWVPLALFFREYRPKKSILLATIGIFLLVASLATVFGVNSDRSFWSNFERMEGLVTYLHLGAYFLLLVSVFRREDWNLFFSFFVSAGLLQSFYALSQKLGYIASLQGGFRVDGTIGNPTYLAAYLIFVAACALILFFKNHPTFSRTIHGAGLFVFLLVLTQMVRAGGVDIGTALAANPILWIEGLVLIALFLVSIFAGNHPRLAKIFYGGTFLFTLLSIYFTATRGVMLALFIAAVIGGVWYLIANRSQGVVSIRSRRIVAGGLIVLVLFGIGLKVFSGSSFVKNSDILSRIASISLSEGKSRFMIWQMGLEGFKDRPILGWGPDAYQLVFGKYYNPALYTQEPWFDRSHMILIDWAINAGILGLIAYLSIFVAAGVLLVRSWQIGTVSPALMDRRRDMAIIAGLLFVYLFQNLFVFDQLATYIGFFSFLAYLYILSTEGGKNIAGNASEGGELWKGFATVTAVVAIFFFWHVGVWKPLQANRNLLEGLRLQSIQNIEGAAVAFEKALSYDTFGNYEIREHMSQFLGRLFASDQPNELKERIFEKLVAGLEQGIEENPGDPRVPLFLGAVYSQAGRFDEALEAFEKARTYSPKKQQIFFEIADIYVRTGNYGKAVEVLKESFDFAPDFNQGRINLAAVYILNGEQAKGDALLKEAFGTPYYPDQILVQVYSARKDYIRLLEIWKNFRANDPANISYHKNVAAIYLELGRRSDAIKTLEDAIVLIPSFKAEGEEFIAAIRTGNL